MENIYWFYSSDNFELALKILLQLFLEKDIPELWKSFTFCHILLQLAQGYNTVHAKMILIINGSKHLCS